ncbi:MAG: GntR family transcriptional regulator [Spirochaetales bacterium]|jgi:GntR family transcriptional regulator
MRFNDGKPIFAQIAELFADDIVAGRIAAGARLPSARDIAASFEVNPNTAARSLQSLAESGIARSERGTGYYVSETGAQTARELRRSRFLEEELPRLFRSIADLDVSFGEIESRWGAFEASIAANAKKDGIA